MRLGTLRVLAIPLIVVVIALTAAQFVRSQPSVDSVDSDGGTDGGTASSPPGPTAPDSGATPTPAETPKPPAELPLGGRTVFPGHFLVAYYGTAGTGSLGVLGESSPDAITARLRKAAAPYARSGRKVQVVYELIVTIADGTPGPDGDYSHDISREEVQRYVAAARRNKALLVLDLQPGHTDFLTAAKRWEWALRKPWVGLALDPEWRMAAGEVPGGTIGQVDASEVNEVSAWLADLVRARDLPQKVFMVHQFRTDMVTGIERVRRRPPLATVQHVDGFGIRAEKMATHHRVVRADRFAVGFKLFYDEDVDMFAPADVLRIRPRVDFVSYQ